MGAAKHVVLQELLEVPPEPKPHFEEKRFSKSLLNNAKHSMAGRPIFDNVCCSTLLPQTLDQQLSSITPGRIGTVMLFPKQSFKILEEKDAGWGRRTNFGRNEDLLVEKGR